MSDLPILSRPVYGGCFNCGPRPAVLSMLRALGVGFGQVTVTRDGAVVWQGDSDKKRVAHVECWAREAAGDWRITFSAPLSEPTYQRQADGWVLVAHGPGFA